LLENFKEYLLIVLPRNKNVIANALASYASVFEIPIQPNKKYEIEVKDKPVVPDNVKYWNFFSG
jgi:stage III sporulation protein SpoIIIAA